MGNQWPERWRLLQLYPLWVKDLYQRREGKTWYQRSLSPDLPSKSFAAPGNSLRLSEIQFPMCKVEIFIPTSQALGDERVRWKNINEKLLHSWSSLNGHSRLHWYLGQALGMHIHSLKKYRCGLPCANVYEGTEPGAWRAREEWTWLQGQ